MITKTFIEPYSEAWFKIRLGKWTASKADLLFKKGRAKDAIFGEMALSHIDTLIAEILTGEQAEAKGWQLDWGLSQEPFAKERYAIITNQQVDECGYYEHNNLSGGTPDFKVNNIGIGEIKCPASSKIFLQICQCQSVEQLNDINPLYYCQPQANILFTGADWCDFVAFDPRIKMEDCQMKIIRIYPDNVWQGDFEYRLGLVAEIMAERIEMILNMPEQMIKLRLAS